MENERPFPRRHYSETDESGRQDPLASRFLLSNDPDTGRPALFFFTTPVGNIESRVSEVSDSIPALMCRIWYGDDDRLTGIDISGEDTAGGMHSLEHYFDPAGIRTGKLGTIHLELETGPSVRHISGAGTLFTDRSGAACFFRLDFPHNL
ncbi:MAG: hypothetical protein ACYS8W_08580 [Planctomycetota bacterium]|jgi:hypothetical protein